MKPTWFIPSLLLILLFAMAARAPVDSDLWWHLRAGQASLETGRPLTVDLFSHTRAGHAWVNHSWLSQIGLFLLFRWGGYLALGAAVALLAAASLGLVYPQMEGHPLLRAFILVLAAAVAASVWSPRPQLASLALFGALGWLLHGYKWRRRDRLWLIVPLFLVWSNLHGGYVLGLLLIGAYLAGETLNHLLGFGGPEVLPWRDIGRLAAWSGAGWLVAAIHPNGTAMWRIPFQTVGVGVLQDFISEWASPDFHQFVQQPFLWLLLATFGAVGISRRRLDGSELLAVAGFAYLAFLARRNYGPFALAAAPVLSRHLVAALWDWQERTAPRWEGWSQALRPYLNDLPSATPAPRFRLALNLAILVLLGCAALVKLYASTSPVLVTELIQASFPVDAVARIHSERPPGELFNAYNWGGYLVWELRDYPVFVDGRTDLFDDELLRTYVQVYNGEVGWKAALDRYGINLVLIEPESGLARELRSSTKWEEFYRDTLSVVYKRQESPR